nr:unnamed protein product [Callosobruchus chinensis]
MSIYKASVEFLGHIIPKNGILMNPKRTNAILNFPTPRNVRELRAFLGFVNYKSRFVDNYSELTVPLLYLLRKNQRWAWGEHEERAFTNVKEAYTNVSIVSHPDFTKDFYIQCDASNYAVGGCLFQESSSSGRNVLAYTSCTLKGAQLRGSSEGSAYFKHERFANMGKGYDLNPGFKLRTPQKQVKALVLSHHNDYGHYGKVKVLQHMGSTFYWPRMQHDICCIAACCGLCQKLKTSNMSKGLLHSVLPTCPGELVCSDLIGPLPSSREGATYALVFVDAFSKHTKIYALKRATSKAILAKLVSDYIPNIQRPKAILSDNGTQFTSVERKAVWSRENIVDKHISVYFTEGNMTERYNREIGRLLRTYCHDKHTRCLRLCRAIEDNQQPPSREVVPVLARERLLAKAEQRAAKFNTKIKPVIFKEGDKVLIRVHAQFSAEDRLIRKLFLLYEGPYIIHRQAGPNFYVLVDDQEQSDGSQTFEEGQESWAENSPRRGGKLKTPPAGRFPMHNGADVHFEPPKVPVMFVLVSFNKVRYAEVQRKLQATNIVSAIKVKWELLGIVPKGSSFDCLIKMDTLYACIIHGLLLQGEAFSKLNDVLQFARGRRAEAIDLRRKAFKLSNSQVETLSERIPSSSTHLFEEYNLAELYRQHNSSPYATHLNQKSCLAPQELNCNNRSFKAKEFKAKLSSKSGISKKQWKGDSPKRSKKDYKESGRYISKEAGIRPTKQM